MLRRSTTVAFLLAGLALLGLAAYSYLQPTGPALDVPEPELALGDLAAERDTEVSFRLENRSGRPIRVVGLTAC